MILAGVNAIWNLSLVFIFGFLPAVFIFGFFSAIKEKSEDQKNIVENNTDKIVPEKEKVVDTPAIDIYKTVKKEAGSYVVVAPDNTEAIVIRVDVAGKNKLWVAALATKNGKTSERVPTKKEAVTLAIELLKEHEESKNGTSKDN